MKADPIVATSGSKVLKHLPGFTAFRFRGAHTKGLFVEHLKVSDVTVPDGTGEKSRADPGVDPKVCVFFRRENREIKTGDVFIVKIFQHPGETHEKCIKLAIFRTDYRTPVLKKAPDIREKALGCEAHGPERGADLAKVTLSAGFFCLHEIVPEAISGLLSI